MKAAPFAYVRPSSLDEAIAELARAGGDGKVIAGGQSLVPVLAMRLARPGTLVDINAVGGLDRIAVTDGHLEIGATVRQRRAERDPACAAVPLLGMALPWVGHRELRSRGTVCGSLAHADPAAELPAVACCLDAEMTIAGPAGTRRLRARDFYRGAMTTALGPDEILTAVRLPAAAPGEGFGFAEIARRHGDFALAGVAIKVRRRGGSIEDTEATLTAFGVSDRPVTASVTGELVAALRACGQGSGRRAERPAERPAERAADRLAEELAGPLAAVAERMTDTGGDAHGSRDYRRRLLRVLAVRELARAYQDGDETITASQRTPQPVKPQPVKPRPVRAGAGERIEVRLTVNGAPAALTLPARVTLADALRDHLGLTGTHIGCEHGVCGMCTVLADGEAARACLMLAPQADGAEITTVEGLGSPDRLHPLQESFGRNHALQCGFCTPGFLMSSYDLLTSNPGVAEEDLPAELSGVICRCTGYRNILAAVNEVRASHPDGLPGPGNGTRRALVGRAAGPASAHQAPALPGADPAQPPPGADAAPERPAEIVLPDGDPDIAVQVSTEIAVAADQVWQVLDDAHRLARCLPGAELTGDLGGHRYAGRARVAAGPVKLAFRGIAHIVERDRGGQRMRVLAQGRDTGGAQTQAEIVLRTEPTAAGTMLRAGARVYLTGRIAQFGRTLAGDASRRMFAQFADAVAETARSGRVPRGPVAAPSAMRLLLSSIADRVRRAFRRLRH